MLRLENKSKGALLIFIASWFLCLSSCLIKSGAYIGPYKLVFYRFIIGMCLVVAITFTGRRKLVFNDKKLLFLRGFTGGIGVFLSVLAITKLGLSKGLILFSSYPISASIFSALFLKEKLRFVNIVALFTAIIGVYLIVYEKGQGLTLLVFGKYEILAIVGAIVAGFVIMLIRKLHDTDDSMAIYFAQCAVGIWLVILPAFRTNVQIGYEGAAIIIGMAIAITIGQLFMTQGLKYIAVKTGSILLLLEPVLGYIAGVGIFHEPLTFAGFFGSVLVIGSCAAVLLDRKA